MLKNYNLEFLYLDKTEYSCQDIGLYIHWPFCISKCPYCDFFSVVNSKISEDFFVDCLLREIDLEKSFFDNKVINSIFFGGGTPSMMQVGNLSKIINKIYCLFNVNQDAEITIEANPGTFDKQKLKDIKSCGINRISVGIQSFQDSGLQFLGRKYDSQVAMSAADSVAKVFENYSFDLIYGYQSQTTVDLVSDLDTLMNFCPPHVSIYQLTFEPGTPFYEKLKCGKLTECSIDEQANFYQLIYEFLLKHNLNLYEISNYSREHFQCIHNLGYWQYYDYVGFGPSACSRITVPSVEENERFSKIAFSKINDVDIWCEKILNLQKPLKNYEILNSHNQIVEFIMMSLRTRFGVNIPRLSKICDFCEVITEEKIMYLKRYDLLEECTKEKFSLNFKGMLCLDHILQFLIQDIVNPDD